MKEINLADGVQYGEREFDEVEALLDLWADWMRRPEPLAEGYPAKASGGFVASWRKDDEDEEEARMAERVARINAAFDSLPRLYQEAIMRHYRLGRSARGSGHVAALCRFPASRYHQRKSRPIP